MPRRRATCGRRHGLRRARSGRVNTRWPPTTTVSLPSMASMAAAVSPGQAGFADEGELGVEHHAGRAAGDRRGRGVQADAARGPDRDVGRQVGQQRLEQDERGQLADPSARFGSPGDEAVGAGGEGAAGFVGRAHLHHHGEVADLVHRPRRVGGEDDGVHLRRQVGRLDRASRRRPSRRMRQAPTGRRRPGRRGPGGGHGRDRALPGRRPAPPLPPGPRWAGRRASRQRRDSDRKGGAPSILFC